jgi:hypothetical protein
MMPMTAPGPSSPCRSTGAPRTTSTSPSTLGIEVVEHGLATPGPIRETYFVDLATTADTSQ